MNGHSCPLDSSHNVMVDSSNTCPYGDFAGCFIMCPLMAHKNSWSTTDITRRKIIKMLVQLPQQRLSAARQRIFIPQSEKYHNANSIPFVSIAMCTY